MRFMTPYRRATNNDIFSEMEKLFSEFNRTPMTAENKSYFDAAYDVHESDKNFNLSIDLPGFKKEDIHIDLKENRVAIKAERKRETGDEKYIMHFERSFTLPTNVDTEKVEAQFEDGVLNLVLPKTTAAKARRIEIQSRTGGSTEKPIASH